MADVGRPTLMTPEVIKKLEEVFAIGGTDLEACFYAGISHQTLYNYQKSNPAFIERKEALKERPVLLARQTVVKNLGENPDLAFKYLERKRRNEFAVRSEVTGADGASLQPDTSVVISELTKKLNEVYGGTGTRGHGTQPSPVGTETRDTD